MSDPDRVPVAGLPDLNMEGLLALADIDMEISEVMRELDEWVEFSESVDRTIVIHLLRMAYLIGKGVEFELTE